MRKRVKEKLPDNPQATSTSPDQDASKRVAKRISFRPILRWVGGKQSIIRLLLECVPNGATERTYYEPFLGAACLYLHLQHRKAILSDLNADLMSMYQYVCSSPTLISRYLSTHASQDSEFHYYETRARFNNATHYSAVDAARFIYLNRTCFNGIYRVNLSGEFNVPYGYKKRPIFPTKEQVQSLADILRPAKIKHAGYQHALSTAKSGDFIYLDPPYPALNGTSFFTHYTRDRFDRTDQTDLAGIVRQLDERGCMIMMSNADTPFIRRMYKGFSFRDLDVPRYVTTKKEKHRVSELVITNY